MLCRGECRGSSSVTVLAALRQNLGNRSFGAEVLRLDLVYEYAELFLAVCLLIVVQRHQQHIDQFVPVSVVCLEVHEKGERIRQLICQIIRDLFTCQHLVQRCHIHIAFLDHITDGSMNGSLLLSAHIGVVGFHNGLNSSDGIFRIAGVTQFEQVDGDSVLFDVGGRQYARRYATWISFSAVSSYPTDSFSSISSSVKDSLV